MRLCNKLRRISLTLFVRVWRMMFKYLQLYVHIQVMFEFHFVWYSTKNLLNGSRYINLSEGVLPSVDVQAFLLIPIQSGEKNFLQKCLKPNVPFYINNVEIDRQKKLQTYLYWKWTKLKFYLTKFYPNGLNNVQIDYINVLLKKKIIQTDKMNVLSYKNVYIQTK